MTEYGRVIKVHDHGYVKLLDSMPRLETCDSELGIEAAIVQSARLSFGKDLTDVKKDRALIRHLFRNQHTSVFESVKFAFEIQCPKFVGIQLIRHRTANVNEFSQRYTEVDLPYFNPVDVDGSIRMKGGLNKQGSVPTEQVNDNICRTFDEINGHLDDIIILYHQLTNMGIANEVARYCLPIAMYTRIRYTMDLHNLLKFLKLRMDSHAQKETRDYANAMYALIEKLVPITAEAFNDYTINSMRLSSMEIKMIESPDAESEINERLSKSEIAEFHTKMKVLDI